MNSITELHILLVDDDPNVLHGMVKAIENSDPMKKSLPADIKIVVEKACSQNEAIKKFDQKTYNCDVAIVDLCLKKTISDTADSDPKGGLNVLKHIKDKHPSTKAILVTGKGYDAIKTVFDEVTNGNALHYLFKFDGPEFYFQLILAIKLAYNIILQEKEKIEESGIIGKHSKLMEVFEMVRKVSQFEKNIRVLISGETGTGKELVARAIHKSSPRKDKEFVSINCAALPEGLLESELFGHEKGAFTGAIETKKGAFERANGGTLFLDEVGEMKYDAQSKLLRAIEQMQIQRVGGEKLIKVDVMIICATNKNLDNEVKSGNFRKDLYYRLNVIPIHVPSLRERKSDIPLLINHFIGDFNRNNKRSIKIADNAISFLSNLAYDWPGNIRELKNYIEDAAVRCNNNVITIEDFNLPQKVVDASGIRQTTEPIIGGNKQIELELELEKRKNLLQEIEQKLNEPYKKVFNNLKTEFEKFCSKKARSGKEIINERHIKIAIALAYEFYKNPNAHPLKNEYYRDVLKLEKNWSSPVSNMLSFLKDSGFIEDIKEISGGQSAQYKINKEIFITENL